MPEKIGRAGQLRMLLPSEQRNLSVFMTMTIDAIGKCEKMCAPACGNVRSLCALSRSL